MNKKTIVRNALSVLVFIVVIPVAGEFFVELAKEWHLIDQPSVKLERLLSVIGSVRNLPGFWLGLFLAGGVVIGMWLQSQQTKIVAIIENRSRVEVETWIPIVESISEFVEPKLVAARNTALSRVQDLDSRIAKLSVADDGALSSEDSDTKKARMKDLLSQRDDAQYVFERRDEDVMADLRRKLISSSLIARGKPVKNGALADRFEIVKPTYWKLMHVNSKLPNIEAGSARNLFGEFREISVGRNRNFKNSGTFQQVGEMAI